MTVLKSMLIAFSMYSKIPMPKVEWIEKNMKYTICFFPFVGVVIGGLMYGWWKLSAFLNIGSVSYSLLGAAIPLVVTGGIHMDGYMDTMDAIHSYGSKEKKLEVLKDPHIGAFSVLMVLLYYLFYVGAFSEVTQEKEILSLAGGFVLSRILSGLAIVWFPAAKREGMLYTFLSASHKKTVRFVLSAFMVICVAVMGITAFMNTVWIVAANGILYYYYYHKSKKEFGGITGDLAGWFLCLSELVTLLCLWMIHVYR